MILTKVQVDTHLWIKDADADGFRLEGQYPADETVWLSYGQLDDVYALIDRFRTIMQKES
jgi:hypothetical protein